MADRDEKTGNQQAAALVRYKDSDISAQSQRTLNNPLAHTDGLTPEDRDFLTMLMNKVDDNKINLYRPSTLLNYPVYDKLSEEGKGKADFDAVNMLAIIREIRKLWNLGHHNTYQIENLAHQLRLIKERLETLSGDIYII